MPDHVFLLEEEIMERMHFQDGITLVAGVVLVATPFVFAITPPEGMSLTLLIANFAIAGVAAIILGAAALFLVSGSWPRHGSWDSHIRRWPCGLRLPAAL
jgi:hypothetical protein